jgi:hypothetical protein
VASDAMAGVVLTMGLKVVFLQSASFDMSASFTLSVGTVTGLPHTRSCSISLCKTRPGRGQCKEAPELSHCMLTEKDMCMVVEVLVHECSWEGVTRCRKWSAVGNMEAELYDKVRWFHWVSCRSQ